MLTSGEVDYGQVTTKLPAGFNAIFANPYEGRSPMRSRAYRDVRQWTLGGQVAFQPRQLSGEREQHEYEVAVAKWRSDIKPANIVFLAGTDQSYPLATSGYFTVAFRELSASI